MAHAKGDEPEADLERIKTEASFDFGEGCGLHYKQASSPEVRWAVVETPTMAARTSELATDRLQFFPKFERRRIGSALSTRCIPTEPCNTLPIRSKRSAAIAQAAGAVAPLRDRLGENGGVQAQFTLVFDEQMYDPHAAQWWAKLAGMNRLEFEKVAAGLTGPQGLLATLRKAAAEPGEPA